MDLHSLLHIAAQACVDGGAAILQVYNNEETQVEIKGDSSPLTQADLRSNEAIMSHLRHTLYWTLSEEGKQVTYSERKSHEVLWIVDPLDGTKEFIKRNGEFTVNVALVKDGKPLLGVVYVPVSGELYAGLVGVGARKIMVAAGDKAPFNIMESGVALPVVQERSFTVVGSRSHMNEETAAFIAELEAEKGSAEILSKGSSLKMCMVAEGLADVYPRFAPTMEWDTAAGQAVVEGAGFSMVEKNTRAPLVYNKEDLLNPHFIVM